MRNDSRKSAIEDNCSNNVEGERSGVSEEHSCVEKVPRVLVFEELMDLDYA